MSLISKRLTGNSREKKPIAASLRGISETGGTEERVCQETLAFRMPRQMPESDPATVIGNNKSIYYRSGENYSKIKERKTRLYKNYSPGNQRVRLRSESGKKIVQVRGGRGLRPRKERKHLRGRLQRLITSLEGKEARHMK